MPKEDGLQDTLTAVDAQIDPRAHPDSNLQHLRHLLDGYRCCVLGLPEDASPTPKARQEGTRGAPAGRWPTRISPNPPHDYLLFHGNFTPGRYLSHLGGLPLDTPVPPSVDPLVVGAWCRRRPPDGPVPLLLSGL